MEKYVLQFSIGIDFIIENGSKMNLIESLCVFFSFIPRTN